MAFKCPCCGIGEMITEVIKDYSTKLGGLPVKIKNAHIAKCNHCHKISVHVKELERWERLQKEK